jgi:hypothetical protein
VEVLIGGVIPPPWGTADIGMVPGSNAYAYSPCVTNDPSKGHFTLNTTGYNPISGNTDQLAGVVQELCEGSGIRAEVQSVGPDTYAGIFMRNSSAAGSPMAGLFTNLTPLLRWESRLQPNGSKSVTPFESAATPVTLGMRRHNGLLQAFYRIPGGSGWQLITQIQDHLEECVEVGFGAFTSTPGGAAVAVIGPVTTIGASNSTEFGGSPAMELTGASGTGQLALWPNPASRSATLSLGAPLEAPAQARLIDGLGRTVRAWPLEVGLTEHPLAVSGLPNGLYWLKVDGQPGAQRLLISR